MIYTLVALAFASACCASVTTPGVVSLDLKKSRKTGDDVIKLSENGAMGLLNTQLVNEQYYYQVELGVGTPPQPVDFTIDTGSSDLWVMDSRNPYCTDDPLNTTGINCTGAIFDPKKSRTYRNLSSSFAINYGDFTSANGTMAKDTIHIGDMDIFNASFAIANVVNTSTCVFGIGFIGNEAQSHVHRNGTGVYPTYFNVPTTMKEQNLISTNAYSLYLNDLNADEGSILFGGTDRAKYDGQLTVMPIYNENSNITDRPTQMRVMLNGISVNQERIADFDIAVLLDSGTSFSYLPTKLVDAIGQAIGFNWDAGLGYYFGSIEAANANAEYLTLNFSGAYIKIPINDLLVGLTTEQGNGETPLTINGKEQAILAIGPASSDYMYILGDVFLRSIYAVFDLDHYEVALAQARKNTTQTDTVPIEAYIPHAVEAPNYAHTYVNSRISLHPYTPAVPAPTFGLSDGSLGKNATRSSSTFSPSRHTSTTVPFNF